MRYSLADPTTEMQKEEPPPPTPPITRSGQSVFMSNYMTKLANQSRLITITWCKSNLLHGLSISVDATPEEQGKGSYHKCKIELKPWYFWRKQGNKQFSVEGQLVEVVWDLKNAKFNGETEPQTDYYVAIVFEGEVILLLGDLKKDAYRKTGCRPSLIDPILVSRKEHVFGKKNFRTRFKFHEKEKFHEISIECTNCSKICSTGNNFVGGYDPKLEIKVDGKVEIEIKNLHWKFRGNESIEFSKKKLEIYWDVHDWLFGSGPRHGLFIFKPVLLSSTSSSSSIPWLVDQEIPCCDDNPSGTCNFCLFLYTWKVE